MTTANQDTFSAMVDLLTQALAPHQAADPYDQLPMAIRQYYSRNEFLFLTDGQKQDLLQNETEPDPE